MAKKEQGLIVKEKSLPHFNTMSSLAQGTIEYLVILAVIVVVSLIVVSLIINSTVPSQGTSEGISKLATKTSLLSIEELTESPDGNIILVLKNNTGERITIDSISVGSDSNNYGAGLSVSTDGTFKLPLLEKCVDGTQTVEEIIITYTTPTGLQKRQTYSAPITIPCENIEIISDSIFTPDGIETGEGGAGGSESICGNNILELGEMCDGTDLNGIETCNAYDSQYDGGTLSCNNDCLDWNAELCTSTPITFSNHITDFSNGEFYRTLNGSVRPTGELDWNVDARAKNLNPNGPYGNGLVMLLKLDEDGAVTSFADASGNGNNGTCSGSACPLNVPGPFGSKVRYFDGLNDQIQVADDSSLDFGSNNFSVGFWVYKVDATSNWDNCMAINKWYTGGSPGMNEWSTSICAGQSTNYASFGIESGTTTYNTISPDEITLKEWHHIVGVRDGDTIYVYVDGVMKNSNQIGNLTVNNVGRNLNIAFQEGSTIWTKAMFEDIAIWNRALSETEIEEIYNDYQPKWNEDNLVAYFKFDEVVEGTDGLDRFFNSGEAGPNGIMFNSSSPVSDGFWEGNNLNLTSSTDYFQSSIPKPSLPITITMWVKSNSSTPVGIFDSASGQQHVLRNYGSGQVEWWSSNPDVLLGLNANKWHHLAFVFKHTGTNRQIAYYRDGQLIETASGTNDSSFAWTTMRLGNINGGSAGWFNGYIDEFKIFETELDAGEIYKDYSAGFSGTYTSEIIDFGEESELEKLELNTSGPWYGEELDLNESLANGLIGLWHLNGNANDSSGNEKNGTFTPNTYATGLWSTQAAFFDGINDYVDIPDTSIPLSSDFSISTWINSNDAVKYQHIIQSYGANSENRFTHNINANQISVFHGHSSGNTLISYTGIESNKWYFTTVVREGNNLKLYVNGELIDSGTMQSSNIAANNQAIGNSPTDGLFSSRNFSGKIDDVAIWSHALSDTEVKQLFNKGAARIGTQYKICNDSACDGENWSTKTYPTNGSVELTGTGQYFRYKNSFELVDLDGETYPFAYAVLEDVNVIYQN